MMKLRAASLPWKQVMTHKASPIMLHKTFSKDIFTASGRARTANIAKLIRASPARQDAQPSSIARMGFASHPVTHESDTRQIDSYLGMLNEEQKQAVYCKNSAVRVKAGPGSGKTRVVTARAAHLIKQGELPSSILVVTFTNKAAAELKERIEGILGKRRGGTRVFAGTFHSICARILRTYVELMPGTQLDQNFSILDTDDSKKAMRKVVHEAIPDTAATQEAKLAEVLVSIYSTIRNEVASAQEINLGKSVDLSRFHQKILPLRAKDLPKYFKQYTSICRTSNGLDFDDLLGETVSLLKQVPQARQELQQQWRHIMVDEFQDTNAAQYELVRLLRGPWDSTTFVVGDSDQAIYSWRGANPDNMDVEFVKDYPGCATLFLSCNYRSGSKIVDSAEAVLSHGGFPTLHQKLVAMKGVPGHVESVIADTERHEAFVVATKIRMLREQGSKYGDSAIIYRTRFQSRLFEEALAKFGIPFRVLGDKPFWSRSEIKTMTCYLRITANPSRDNLALDEIINTPARGIGGKSLSKLRDVAKSQGLTLAKLLLGDLQSTPLLSQEELEPLLAEVEQSGNLPNTMLTLLPDVGSQLSAEHKLGLTKSVIAGLRQLRAVIHLARSTAAHRPVHAVVNVLQLTSGFLNFIREEEKPNKLESLQILYTIAKDPTAWSSRDDDLRRQQNASATAQGSGAEIVALTDDLSRLTVISRATDQLGELQLFLQHVALMTDLENLKEQDAEGQRVTLMTVHAAKGLEFPSVFFVGFEEGLVPLMRADSTDIQNDEEKRLAYVGCTRAMERLYLVRAEGRSKFGGGASFRLPTKPSPYMKKIESCRIIQTICGPFRSSP